MMQKITLFILSFIILSLSAFAQINIKFPKIGQPKATPKPNSTQTTTNNQNNSDNSVSSTNIIKNNDVLTKPEANENPVLLKTTLDVRADLENRYWKFPKESNYTSWIPQVRFKVFYKGNSRLRYNAEYFLPDGKTWFTETLEQDVYDYNNQTLEIKSSRAGERFINKSTNAIGLYGVKITNSKDNSVVFQGKFKVNKYKYGPTIPMFKNQYCFYVEHDWNLPIGYVWLKWSGSGLASPLPTASMWFKDDLRSSDLEARLFYKGQEIATTDDMGEAEYSEYRIPNVQEKKAETYYRLWNFSWYKIRYAQNKNARDSFRQAKFINDMDGEYVVKVFLKGQQAREIKFNVSGGNLVDNGIAKQNNIADHKIIVPVKIMNTTEKWNVNAWKTDAFYGNPLTGFSLQ